MQSACDTIATDCKPVDLLFADGTGYKRTPRIGQSNRGEVRLVIGVDAAGQVAPFGAWTQESWATMGQALQASPGDGEASDPLARLLLTDGEGGIPDGLGHLAEEHSRCHWHQVHDLSYVMCQGHGAFTRKQRRRYQMKLAGILDIALPAEDFEQVAWDDKVEIVSRMLGAEDKLDALIATFRKKKCEEAARYLENAKDQLFGYVRVWLEYGIVSPRATTLIERLMRELGRRLKKIDFGWSESGAAKIARIITKRVASAREWTAFWEERVRIVESVHLVFRGVKILRPGTSVV